MRNFPRILGAALGVWALWVPSLFACSFVSNLDNAVERQLRAQTGSQVITIDGLTGRGPAEITIQYGGGVGAPRVSGTSDKAKVIVPRTFLLDVFTWEQQLLTCEFVPSLCALDQETLDAFARKISVTGVTLLTPPIENDPSCTFRGDPTFGQRAHDYYISSIALIQLHEMAHVILGHLDSGKAVGVREEAQADGLAWQIIALGGNAYPNGRGESSAVMLALQRQIFASRHHPPARCRAIAFGAPANLWPNPGPDCSEYLKFFAEGIGFGRYYFTNKTTMEVYP